MPVKAPPPAPVPLPYNWGGLYLGGYVGYLWGRTRVEEDGLVTEPNAATNGVIGGVLAGYNRQAGPGIFGVEGDFGWTDAHGTGLVSNPIIQPNTYDVNWTGHVRGRLGYAFNTWLLFVAGGFVVADFNFHEGEAVSTIPSGGRYNGWSIGGGVEVAILRNLIGRIEYLYDDFGSKDYIGVTGDPYRVHFHRPDTTLRAGVEIRSFRQETLSALMVRETGPG
ncbi:MAG: outer membrane beta-barrel protein [Pseudolabrys sp.]